MEETTNKNSLWVSAMVLNLGVAIFVIVPPASKAVATVPNETAVAPRSSIDDGSGALCGGVFAQKGPEVEAAPLIGPASQHPSGDMWLSENRRCRRAGARDYCDGPRWVARPFGAGADLARLLGLGTGEAAAKLLRSRPEPRWIEAVETPVHGSLLPPVDGARFGRGFGFTRLDQPELEHRGIDFGAQAGAPIRAVEHGIVAYSDNGIRGYGNLVILVHSNGTSSFYAHCRANYVFAGQQVERGQVIAEVGSTGLARGAHLHFELHRGGDPIDPSHRFDH